MTAYTDVLQANRLIEEQARLAVAINMIDEGGTISSFTVAPKPVDPTPTPRTAPLPPTTPLAFMVINPPPELMAAARTAMVKRHNEILVELEALGVSGTPSMSR